MAVIIQSLKTKLFMSIHCIKQPQQLEYKNWETTLIKYTKMLPLISSKILKHQID